MRRRGHAPCSRQRSAVFYTRAARVVLDVVPFALVLGSTFVAATIRSLDQQTWRALAYAIGIHRRDALLKSVVESSTDCIVCIDDAR